MSLSTNAQSIISKIANESTKLGDLRKIAKEIKRDHELAMELWSTGDMMARQLAILIMDKRELSQEVIDRLDKDMRSHSETDQTQLMDWLLGNQLSKDKKTIALMNSWEKSSSSLQRRTFWYYQARLRWTGQTPPDNTEYLLSSIEENLANEESEVQWAMNFLAGWIGVYDEYKRAQCVAIGEESGLYKDEVVARGCTPSYLPEFIRIEVEKRKAK